MGFQGPGGAMAEDDLEEDYTEAVAGGGKAGGGGGKKKLILLIVLPLLLIIGGVAGAYFAGLFDSSTPPTAEEGAAPPAGTPAAGEGEKGAPPVAAGPVFYDLDQVVVDLNSSGRRRSYLQLRLSLQLASSLDIPRVEEAMPRIMDTFIAFLRELRLEDLQGTAGMYRIQEELLIRVNAAAAPARVEDVLFKEMLIQ
ncbi:Flagellar basal body-associated protein FliL [Rhodospirillum rubrum ATCC 11170]|uniref:Flagellar protein FliL n=2 Tax=Rhodospirillum rubrum TaxID=1085 RepID=Q2RQF7_RHORT|nr:Flagellar basal body-associated protein FliL [Rhodospirillum rubrum ATCC 11170]MBK5955314.1 flagellar basal body protein FliL [Rhodospirillum rubrum]